MFRCPNCGERFDYGYPCIHELILRLLYAGKWKCSKCGIIIVSNQQLVELNEDEMVEVVEQYNKSNTTSEDKDAYI